MTNQSKERPILFSGPMVRAILEGRKTVTRRVHAGLSSVSYRGLPFADAPYVWMPPLQSGEPWYEQVRECPYGRLGDRLWVREAWAADTQLDAVPPRDLSQGEPIPYTADGSVRQMGCSMISQGRGRPSIHMPRWASRILLEITDVRVERLQGISEPQALAEGVVGVDFRPDDGFPICRGYMVGPDDGTTPLETHASKAFAGLWRSINGAESWNANPWVWVVEFKRIGPSA